ncbi:uncharacterized protein [Apostichopus japonicus]|uniref:uncharacterized protein n=1 Tax=Stichopus japonicus TaxID=307972 RepID=UPI003AB81B24
MQPLCTPCRISDTLLLTIVCFIAILDLHLACASLKTADCLCDIYGTVNPNVCDVEVAQRCTCKEGHTGADCSHCLDDFYRPSQEEVCKACKCNSQGSDSTCDRSGSCSCLTGYAGRSCHQCDVGAYASEKQTCQICQCESLEPCLQLKDYRSDTICSQCLKDVSWTAQRCNICDAEHDVIIQENKLECVTPKTSAMEATSRKEATTTPPQKEQLAVIPPATIYVTIVVLTLAVIAIIFTVVMILKKRQGLRHPANFPFWTVELQQAADNTSLPGANEASNDGDVMYLDDAYLMDSPENFTTAVDTIHEDDRIGYHTLR